MIRERIQEDDRKLVYELCKIMDLFPKITIFTRCEAKLV